MKKMKGIAAMESSLVFEYPRSRFKHQSLMQDYEELEKVKKAFMGFRILLFSLFF